MKTENKEPLIADDVRAWLNHIGKTPLLQPEEEISLAHAFRSGDKKAKDKLIEANFRLVVSIAKRYNIPGMTFIDVIQIGNIGLIKAVENFEPEKGYHFSTYATCWIRQTITRAISKQKELFCLLNEPIGDDDDTSLIDTIANDDDFEEKSLYRLECYFLEELFEHLSPREQEIINCHFFENITFAEIGERLHISSSRAQSIGQKALKKLRTRLITKEDMI